MANGYLAISDGTFTLSETEKKSQFYFFRNDGEVLTDIDREPMELYQAYIMRKMMNGEITEMVISNIYSAISDDGKCMRLTVRDIGDESVRNQNSAASGKHPNILKRLIKKIFG